MRLFGNRLNKMCIRSTKRVLLCFLLRIKDSHHLSTGCNHGNRCNLLPHSFGHLTSMYRMHDITQTCLLHSECSVVLYVQDNLTDGDNSVIFLSRQSSRYISSEVEHRECTVHSVLYLLYLWSCTKWDIPLGCVIQPAKRIPVPTFLQNESCHLEVTCKRELCL